MFFLFSGIFTRQSWLNDFFQRNKLIDEYLPALVDTSACSQRISQQKLRKASKNHCLFYRPWRDLFSMALCHPNPLKSLLELNSVAALLFFLFTARPLCLSFQACVYVPPPFSFCICFSLCSRCRGAKVSTSQVRNTPKY